MGSRSPLFHFKIFSTFIIALLQQMNTPIYILIALHLLVSCGRVTPKNNATQPANIKQTDTCDNPDANINCCFNSMPANLSSVMTIDNGHEPGEKLVISGTIYKADGATPYANIIVYAYHTNSKGYYAKVGDETSVQKWHGHLHGWCKTDSKGYYEIRSIRPARYPSNTIPAHIHAAIREPQGNGTYYISDFVFKDDSLVNDKYVKSIRSSVGGTGIVNLVKSPNGTWRGQRNIVLAE